MTKSSIPKTKQVSAAPITGPVRGVCVFPRIEQIIQEQRLSYNHIGRLLNYRVSHVSNQLRGTTPLRQPFKESLAELFGWEGHEDELFARDPE